MTGFRISPEFAELEEQAADPTQPGSGSRQLYPKNDGWYDQDSAGTVTKIGAGGGGGGIGANLLINGSMTIAQRPDDPILSISFDDGEYGACDRWKGITSASSGSNNLSAVRVTGDEQRYTQRLEQENATASQIGMVQFIEGANCRYLRGQEVTVSARVSCSEAETIRLGVLHWNGTEDTLTSDPVSSWAATPTWATNYTLAGSGSVSPAANTWTDITATFTLSAGFNNLAFIVWTEGTLAQNNRLLMEAAKLEAGGAATDFVPRPVAEELALCQRYYQRIGGGSTFVIFGSGLIISSSAVRIPIYYTEKRSVPTLGVSAASDFQVFGGVTAACDNVLFGEIGFQSCRGQFEIPATTLTSGDAVLIRGNNTTSARITIDAEL
jgi:hypothetical protein